MAASRNTDQGGTTTDLVQDGSLAGTPAGQMEQRHPGPSTELRPEPRNRATAQNGNSGASKTIATTHLSAQNRRKRRRFVVRLRLERPRSAEEYLLDDEDPAVRIQLNFRSFDAQAPLLRSC